MNKKILNLAFVFAAVAFLGKTSFAHDFKPALVVQPPENVFAPMGFDDNDNAQITLYGNLPSTCYKAGAAEARVDKDKKTIFIRNTLYMYSGCWCAEVMTPYLQTVNLGVMNAGSYNIEVEKADGTFQKMATVPIAVNSSTSPDDFLYAPVDHVHFNKTQGSAPSEVVISGVFHNTCMILKETKVNYRPNHVIEILPIVEMEKGKCVVDSKTFTTTVKLTDATSGLTLIHVRSLNGQAINQVVEL